MEKHKSEKRKRLCVIVTSAVSLKLFQKQWLFWQEQGWDISCIAGVGEDDHDAIRALGVTTHVIPMQRKPSFFKDILSIIYLWCFFLWHRYDVLHISTPKASFLSSIAARLSFHNRIYYLLRGRAYENMTGIKRKIMCTCEWITCHLSTVVVPICREMGQLIVDEGLCSANKLRFVGSGSSAGIDLDKYTLTQEVKEQAIQLRKDYGIPSDAIVFIYVGWIHRDKGSNEIIYAFRDISEKHPGCHLVLLGEFELSDPLDPVVVQEISNNGSITHIKWQKNPAAYYAMADMLVFPSYREGFGNVAIEGAAMELPVIASDIMGCREAVLDNETGILVEKENVVKLVNAIETLLANEKLRKQFATAGRKRIVKEFSQQVIYNQTNEILNELIR